MELIRITDLSQKLGITSRSLRYYEEAGLIESVRPDGEKYRYYAPEAVERLKQILVLRKMQIPIKDILRIYQSADMGALVEAFVDKMRAIDGEVSALLELKRIVNEFLLEMTRRGIRRISALPLIYETLDARLATIGRATLADVDAVSERLSRPLDLSIVSLPPFRALTSVDASGRSDVSGFWGWAARYGIAQSAPGSRGMFEFQTPDGQSAILVRAPEGLEPDGAFQARAFPGGLYASVSAYADEDLARVHRAMIAELGESAYYEVDYLPDGRPRCESLIEGVLSPDDLRERLEMLVAVRRRTPDARRYEGARRVVGMTLEALEAEHAPLAAHDIPLSELTRMLNPRFTILESGEAEYVAFVDKRVLSTNIPVSVPFRVDLVFKTDEAPICLYHGRAMAGINLGDYVEGWRSRNALHVRQPVFGDEQKFADIGGIEKNEYNTLTWIVGERHVAVIVNGEVRYCASECPYMKASPVLLDAHPVIVGANHSYKVYLRSVRVTQLIPLPRIKARAGALRLSDARASNRLSDLHQLITMHYGENYWFNGCLKFLFERLGRPEFDYWFFSGVTGDNLAQVWSYDRFRGDGVSDYLQSPEYVKRVFADCGYSCAYVAAAEFRANKEKYIGEIIAAIDRGVPVIAEHHGWKVVVGYEQRGRILLTMTADKAEPDILSTEGELLEDWIFAGEKLRDVTDAEVYRKVVFDMPRLLTVKTGEYCFGAEAFRAWADKVESGGYEAIDPATFEQWFVYTIYVCCVATNGSCRAFLERALQKNPDMAFLAEIIAEYKLLGELWNNPGGLESLGGGFNIALDTLKDAEKRAPIAAKIRECADAMDRVLAILHAHL